MTTPPEFDLNGLIDLHIHGAPDIVPRYADDLDLAREATAAGMRAILIKSHVTLTADRATLVERAVGGLRVFGGLALNYPVGGLNPTAVEVAIQHGAQEIWMPTRDAANEYRLRGRPGGVSILDPTGHVVPSVHDILDLIRDADIMLGTGHLSVLEIMVLTRLARERGLRKILITHPEASFVNLTAEAQRELRGPGVFFERCALYTTSSYRAPVPLTTVAANIRAVGVESTILATDFGQAQLGAPVNGLRTYLASLHAAGFREAELRRMAGETPAALLGL